MGSRVQGLVAVLAAVVVAAVARGVPLLAVPSYEPGLLVGAFALLACAHLAFERARIRPSEVSLRWGLLELSPGEAVWHETRANVQVAAAVVLLPLVVLWAGAVGTGCRLAAGTATYLFVAAPSALMGVALGTLAGSLTRRRGPALALLAAALAAGVIGPAAELAAGPRVILHSLLLGPLSASGWSGYDATLAFPSSAYLHRALACVVAAGLLVAAALVRTWRDAPPPGDSEATPPGAAWESWQASRADAASRARFLLRHHRRVVARAGALVLAALAPFLLAPHACGLLSGRAPLERALDAVAETPHFRIHHARGSAAEAHVARLAVELEAAREQVTGWLGVDPPWKVDAWVHPDEATLRRLTGAHGYLFAQPWNREFHAVLDDGEVRALRHELVHVLAADSGAWPFRASLSMGLTEGLATALDEGFVRDAEAHAQVAAAARAGRLPHARELVSLSGFAGGGMDRSYRSAGSFVGWLLRTHGPAAVMRGYATGDLRASFGSDLDALDAAWRAFLGAGVPSTTRQEAAGRERFDPARRPAFHRTPCARLGVAAADDHAGRAAMLAREGMSADAAAAWCEAAVTGSDPAHLHAAALQHARAGRSDLAIPLVERALAVTPAGSIRREPLLRLRARVLGAAGRWDEALAAHASWRDSGLARHAQDVELERLALERADLREAWVAAAVAAPPEDLRRASALLATAPDWDPARHLVLARAGAASPPPAERAALAEALATSLPGPLAAEHLVAASRAQERTLDWEASAALARLALAQPGLEPSTRRDAEDALVRARLGPEVTASLVRHAR